MPCQQGEHGATAPDTAVHIPEEHETDSGAAAGMEEPAATPSTEEPSTPPSEQ